MKEITKIYGNQNVELSQLQNKVIYNQKGSPSNTKMLWTDRRSLERERSKEERKASPKREIPKFKKVTSKIIPKPVNNEPNPIVQRTITKVKMTPFLRRVQEREKSIKNSMETALKEMMKKQKPKVIMKKKNSI